MNDGSAGSSLQSLREFSSANSEFELVDVVGSRLSSVRSKQPSSVDVFWSSTSPAVHSPVLSNLKFDHQSSTLKEGNGHCEIHENEQKSPNEMDILLENKRLRAELAEAKVQLIAMSKEIETYRQTMREGLSKKNEGLSKAMEEMQTVDKSLAEPRQWKNGSKTSSMCVGLGSMLQQSEFENSKNLIGQCFDKGTAKAKQRPMPSPLTCNSKTALCVLRSTSSPPLPKFSPPRNVADAQLLDLLGSVQPMRDANRPAAPPPKKNSWCKLCGEWLCNSYFLRAHIQSQHATHGENDKENGPKSGKKHQNALDFEEVTVSPNSIHCSAVDAELVIEKALFDSDSSQRLIDINGESQSAVLNKVVRPKPIRPVPSGKFQIKWEEEDEETDEEKLMNGAKDHSSWSLIGQLTDEGRNGKTDTEKKLTNELSKYDGYENVGQQKKKQQMDLSSPIAHSFPSSVTSSSVSPFVSHFRSLSSERKLQQQLCSSSSSSDSALSSSTASSTMSSPNNTSEDEGLSYGLRRERNAQEEQNEMHNSKLDDSILNRLLHIDPPNNTNKQKSSNEISHSYVSDNENEKATETRGVERDDLLGEDFKKFDYDIGNELSKLRNDFHSLHFLHENTHRQTNQRLYILENRMAELNVQLKTFDTQTETVRGEHKIQMANLVLENGRLCQEFGQQQKGLKAVQGRIELLEHCHLRAFVARLPPVFEDGSLVLSQFEKGIYCAELKMLFKSGARFCSGLAIKGSAHFRNYPANLFNQLIEHALTTRHVQKMIRWTVLNFPTDEKCPWPQVLLSLGDICTANGSNDTDDRNNDNSKLYIYRNWVRKRAVLSDRVVYSLLNQHSSHKFVVNIYYSSDAELFKRMHCFTIRRHRPSLGI